MGHSALQIFILMDQKRWKSSKRLTWAEGDSCRNGRIKQQQEDKHEDWTRGQTVLFRFKKNCRQVSPCPGARSLSQGSVPVPVVSPCLRGQSLSQGSVPVSPGSSCHTPGPAWRFFPAAARSSSGPSANQIKCSRKNLQISVNVRCGLTCPLHLEAELQLELIAVLHD